MLFNSYVFLFAFLPITLFVYFSLNYLGKYQWAKISLVLAFSVFGKNTQQLVDSRKIAPLLLPLSLVMFLFSVLSLSGVSTFLYFNF